MRAPMQRGLKVSTLKLVDQNWMLTSITNSKQKSPSSLCGLSRFLPQLSSSGRRPLSSSEVGEEGGSLEMRGRWTGSGGRRGWNARDLGQANDDQWLFTF
ncbi:hypothetical protein CDL15_Pgr005311 [Punica granatum]|uniref:Uncharacterized protein n=1 Tax=Punica granatum TaxID=22663 RepID=A0A218XEK6_PUNGR|nr:hypothetical protein CDL15_Pgr005311 [Punica granatum]